VRILAGSGISCKSFLNISVSVIIRFPYDLPTLAVIGGSLVDKIDVVDIIHELWM